ncbi:MAG: hypothetical protein P8X58_01200 [Syntrophobacterales bacterium]
MSFCSGTPDHLRDAVNLLADFPHGERLENFLVLPTANYGAGMGI